MDNHSLVRQFVNKFMDDKANFSFEGLDLMKLQASLRAWGFELDSVGLSLNTKKVESITGSFPNTITGDRKFTISLDPQEDAEMVNLEWEVLESDIESVEAQLKTSMVDAKAGFISLSEVIRRLEAENNFQVQWVKHSDNDQVYVYGYFYSRKANVIRKSRHQVLKV